MIGQRTGQVELTKEMRIEPTRHLFIAGAIDAFDVEGEDDIGELLKIKIGHDNSALLHDDNAWLLGTTLLKAYASHWSLKDMAIGFSRSVEVAPEPQNLVPTTGTVAT